MKARFVILAVLVALIALPEQGQGQERRQTTRTTVGRRQPPQRSQGSRITAAARTTSSARIAGVVQLQSNYRNYGNYGRGYNYHYDYGRRYIYGRGYSYGYGRYGGYYVDGYSGPLAIGGAAVATALKSSAPGVIGGVVLGWLLGQHLDNVRVQQPVENVQWYEDSNGERYWQKSGVQTRTVRPAWVDPPAKQVETNKPAEEPANEPDATVVP
ncbi:MAG TPA: hypothetical protein VMW21_01630 [Patescibacteria group bacterium]|nr:hypothetical protein [Patescibacteria group bacterium]